MPEVPTLIREEHTYINQYFVRKFGKLFQNLGIPKGEIITIPSTLFFLKKNQPKLKNPRKAPGGWGFYLG